MTVSSTPGEAWQQPPVVFTPLAYPGRRAGPRAVRMATASLVFGIVALVLNVLLVPTILAIVFGTVSLVKQTTARGRAIAGIVLGGAGVLTATAIAVAVAIPVMLAAQHTAVSARVQNALVNELVQQGAEPQSVDCPPAPTIAAGATMTCSAVTQRYGRLRIVVTFQDGGAFTSRATRVG